MSFVSCSGRTESTGIIGRGAPGPQFLAGCGLNKQSEVWVFTGKAVQFGIIGLSPLTPLRGTNFQAMALPLTVGVDAVNGETL
jgi:hypothetical protein